MADTKNLVLEFLERLGLDGVTFDANSIASIMADERVLNVQVIQDTDEIMLFVALGDIPAGIAEKAAVYAYLLKTNNFALDTGGAVLGIDDAETTVYLSHRFAATALSVVQLEDIVESFLNLTDSLVAGMGDARMDASAAGTNADDIPQGMRV